MISDGHVYGCSRASEVCTERAGRRLYWFLESEYRVPVRGKERRAFVLEMISDRHVCGDNRASEVCKERVETCLYWFWKESIASLLEEERDVYGGSRVSEVFERGSWKASLLISQSFDRLSARGGEREASFPRYMQVYGDSRASEVCKRERWQAPLFILESGHRVSARWREKSLFARYHLWQARLRRQ